MTSYLSRGRAPHRAHADQVVESGKIASASPAGGSIDVRRLQQQQRELLARMEELERIQHDRDQNLSRRDRTLSPVNYPRGDKKMVRTGRTNSMSPPPHAARTSSKSLQRSLDISGRSKSPQRYADRSGSRSPDHPLARTGSSPQQIKQKQMELLARLQQLQAKQLSSPGLSRTGSLDRRALSTSICHTSDPLLSRTASSERHRVSGVISRSASSERRPLSGALQRTPSSERHPLRSASFGARHGEHKSRTQSPLSRPASMGSMSSEQLQAIMLKVCHTPIVLKHTATHTATRCNTPRNTLCSTLCITLQHAATLCNTLQHTAARCHAPGLPYADYGSILLVSLPVPVRHTSACAPY